VFNPKPSGLRLYLSLIKAKHREAYDWTSKLYSETSQRGLASEKLEEIRNTEKKKIENRERRISRRLFEKKTLGFTLDEDLSSHP
jgi:hypothetical protein